LFERVGYYRRKATEVQCLVSGFRGEMPLLLHNNPKELSSVLN